MVNPGEHEKLTSTQRHQLADSVGRMRVALLSLVDNADLIDATNVSVMNSLDHSRVDKQYEVSMSAAVITAQMADAIREAAHYYRATADEAAAEHGIGPATS